MQIIRARNVHEALQNGMHVLEMMGVKQESRVGDVLVMKEPVTTVYEKPEERVLFWAERDANPFFHFMEGLWMLAGRNDVEWISQFNSSIRQFSDDGVSFHGPYGFRWVNHFVKEVTIATNEKDGVHGTAYIPFNQLDTIAQMLRDNPNERRCVLQMWDAEADLGHKGKDIPCNTQIYFRVGIDKTLDMTVLNRSNDIIWGAYGANAVHMSMLQEFMAAWIGVPVGTYWQVSNNWHAYVDVFEKHSGIAEAEPYNPYDGVVEPFPMVNGPMSEWLEDLSMFMDHGPVPAMKDRFFRKVVAPIWNAWFAWKNTEDPHRVNNALVQLSSCQATDWQKACAEWIQRRTPGRHP